MNIFHVPGHDVRHAAAKVRGFTLVELMVALLLGLIVIAGVSSVFLANLRSYHSNTALSQVQSNARVAFELMARDIRQAGLTGCNSTSGRLANVLENGPHVVAAPVWWASWASGVSAVQGYGVGETDPAAPARAASTDSLMVIEASGKGLSVDTEDTGNATITLNNTSSDLQIGDVIVICNPDHAAIAQLTGKSGGGGAAVTLTHAVGGGADPGNCTVDLGYYPPLTPCGGRDNHYQFGANASVSKLSAQDWYIGSNPVGGYSLYRVALANDGGVPTPEAQEMVRNVTNMQITYHQSGDTDFVDAAAVVDWNTVDAVHITYTLQSADQRAGVDDKQLTRTFASTTTLRNRLSP